MPGEPSMPQDDAVSNLYKCVPFKRGKSIHVIERTCARAARIATASTCSAVGGEGAILYAAADGKARNLLFQLGALALGTGGPL